jgi:CRISPR-associated protein Cmr2
MNLDFSTRTETLKEKISTLSIKCKNKEAEVKVKKYIEYLCNNNHDDAKLIDYLIVSSYMYLKIINPDAPSLEKLKSEYKKKRSENCGINEKLRNSLSCNLNCNNLSFMPPYSFIIEFDFTLEKPYISKDDENFTIIENSIKREKVLGCPYIPGSTWKGCLRSALWHEGMKEDDEQITRIFGNERQKNESFRQGRLHFFPSFFDKVDYEIINPHDRKTRTGTVPILIESIPSGTNSKFSLLYVPFDLTGREKEESVRQMLEDLKIIAEGLEAMFTVYGFGAKTSSGYGIASNIVKDGKVYTDMTVKIEQKSEAMKLPENFRKYLNENGTVKSELVDDRTGKLLSNSKFQKKKTEHGFKSGNEFSKFKRWYEENGESYINSLSVKNSPQNVGEFASFAELVDLTKAIADLNAQTDTAGGNPDE